MVDPPPLTVSRDRALRAVPVPPSVIEFAAHAPPAGTGDLSDSARVRLEAALSRNPRITVCGGWARILVPPGSAAWTLGRWILVRSSHWSEGDPATARLVSHELVHVAQWADSGVCGFLRRYLADYLRGRARGLGHWDAYRAIRAEVEAHTLDEAVAPHL